MNINEVDLYENSGGFDVEIRKVILILFLIENLIALNLVFGLFYVTSFSATWYGYLI